MSDELMIQHGPKGMIINWSNASTPGASSSHQDQASPIQGGTAAAGPDTNCWLDVAPTVGQALLAQSYDSSNRMHFKDGHPPGPDFENFHKKSTRMA